MDRLADKVVVIVGGARGIGWATVQNCLGEGAQVFMADLRRPEGQPVKPDRFAASELDATDPAPVGDFFARVYGEVGRIDGLLNNVGIHLPKSIVDATPEEFDLIFRVNVRPAYLACRAVVPGMIERRRGSIVNMSSNGGLMGRPGDPLYNASKHAIIGLTRSLAVAYAHEGLRVNAVCPGPVDTPMLRMGISSEEEFAARLPQLVASTPAARVADPDEVAAAVVFLLSDESTFINGAAIPVDGAKAAGAMPPDRYRTDFRLYTTPA